MKKQSPNGTVGKFASCCFVVDAVAFQLWFGGFCSYLDLFLGRVFLSFFLFWLGINTAECHRFRPCCTATIRCLRPTFQLQQHQGWVPSLSFWTWVGSWGFKRKRKKEAFSLGLHDYIENWGKLKRHCRCSRFQSAVGVIVGSIIWRERVWQFVCVCFSEKLNLYACIFFHPKSCVLLLLMLLLLVASKGLFSQNIWSQTLLRMWKWAEVWMSWYNRNCESQQSLNVLIEIVKVSNVWMSW